MKHSSPQLVFGTGGRFGRLSQSLADKLVSYALSQHVTIFDTGFEYCNGKSQQKLLQALRPVCLQNRSSFKFSTKVKAPRTRGVITNRVSRVLASPLQYIDYLFVWGPSISELSSPFLFDELNSLKENRLINSIGVNTHDLTRPGTPPRPIMPVRPPGARRARVPLARFVVPGLCFDNYIK